jgi:hypothetical protein
MDRLIKAASARDDWNMPSERREVLDHLAAARRIYAAMAATPAATGEPVATDPRP